MRRRAPEAPERLNSLSEREREVLRLLAQGRSNAEIGQALFLGENTVKSHVTHLFDKLGVRNRVEAAILAHETGLGDGDSPE